MTDAPAAPAPASAPAPVDPIIYYSKTEGGFFTSAYHSADVMPADAMVISAALHQQMLDGQAAGQMITADATGLPALAARPVAIAAPPTKLAPLDFMHRFTDAELTAIYTAAQSNVPVAIYIGKCTAAGYIDLLDPLTKSGLDALVSAGLLTAARETTILTP